MVLVTVDTLLIPVRGPPSLCLDPPSLRYYGVSFVVEKSLHQFLYGLRNGRTNRRLYRDRSLVSIGTTEEMSTDDSPTN